MFHKIKFSLLLISLFSLSFIACNNEVQNNTETTPVEVETKEKEIEKPRMKISEMSYQQASENMLRDLKDGKDVNEYAEKFAAANLEQLAAEINTDDKKKAFWINLYNAYIRSSTMKLSGGFLGEIFVGGYEKKLRTDEVDPRIHFAVNCGAKDCPQVHILSPDTVNAELDKMTQNYLNKVAEYDATTNIAKTTSLMSWFRGDWGGKDGVVDFLKKYDIVPATATDVELKFKDYDWTLNTGMYAEEV